MVSEEDMIERVRLLNSLGYSVLISDYTRYFSLRAYFRQFTNLQIGIVVGIRTFARYSTRTATAASRAASSRVSASCFPTAPACWSIPRSAPTANTRLRQHRAADEPAIPLPTPARKSFHHRNRVQRSPTCSRFYSREVLKRITERPRRLGRMPARRRRRGNHRARLFGFRD